MLWAVTQYSVLVVSARQLFGLTAQCNSSPCRHVEVCNLTTGRSVFE